jgi:hypothetical protein
MTNNDLSGEPPESGKPPRGKARRRTMDLTANEVTDERADLTARESHQQAGEVETSAPAVPSQDAEAGAQQADADQSAARPTAEPSSAESRTAPLDSNQGAHSTVAASFAEAGATQVDANQGTRPTAESSFSQPEHSRPDPGSGQDLSARPERVQPRMPILWPLLAGGAAGAAGAALALVLASLFTGGDASALAARLARLEQQFMEWTARPSPAGMEARMLDEIASRVAKLEAAHATTTSDSAVANRVSMLEGEVKALGERMGMLGRRSEEAATAAREARARADATAAAMTELAQKTAAPQIDGSQLEALAARLAALERGQKTLEAELARTAPAADRVGRLATAAAALVSAMERGVPFKAELAAVKALGADPKLSATLEPFASTGVPAGSALVRELVLLIPSLREAVGEGRRDGNFLDKLAASAEKLVRIRRLEEEVAGTDPAAIVARIEVKAAQGDIAGAHVEMAQLPPAARAPAQAWMEKAQTRATAIEASRRLNAEALASLTK